MLSEVKKYLNAEGIGITELRVSPDSLGELLTVVDSGEISGKIAKAVFVEMARTADSPRIVIERNGLAQITDESALNDLVEQVLAVNPESVEAYRSGKKNALKFLMGQVMKASKGKANPQMAASLLSEKLS
jgi:aspartyl-tRNA(Asn)/glutamyl-tRNA(Gln) amidotransferase subunit B